VSPIFFDRIRENNGVVLERIERPLESAADLKPIEKPTQEIPP
jgi:hypothetical protein